MTSRSKAQQFRDLLHSPDLSFICESHNGLSAKIVEKAGFKGIWGSGLSLSAQYGVRDNNEASWTQILEMLEFMSDATSIPILLDGDTGYGNFNNMRRLVNKLEQREIAAVCIEDKLFPKTNSFIKGDAQPLADMDEFCGKIKAGKDAQRDDNFSIIARVEAFIAGWGLDEALRRSEAYHEAGADAILIHSALSVPDEILAFKKEWADRSPVVIVPTKYYATPTDVFRDAGFDLVIWANHLMRASMGVMQDVTKTLMNDENLLSIEDRIPSVADVFRIQGADELQIAEKLYLPQSGERAQVVVLAASRGKELGDLTKDRPKAMVPINGKPLLAHIVENYNAVGVKDITVVRGYKKDAIDLTNLTYVDNEDYESTGELASLEKALSGLDEKKPLLVSYGDVLFNKYIPQSLMDDESDIVIAVDTNWQQSANRERVADYVSCSEPSSRHSFGVTITLDKIGPDVDEADIHGEWMGFVKFSAAGIAQLLKAAKKMSSSDEGAKASIPALLNHLLEQGQTVNVIYTAGHWLDIDSLDDVTQAGGAFK